MRDAVGAAARVFDQAALTAFELDFQLDGVRRRMPSGACWDRRYEAAEPVRDFNRRKEAPGFAGWYYSVTVQDHVGYESWLERDPLVLLDRDPEVTAIASQPFWLHWHDGTRKRRHAPDYFIRLADGRGRVVDVRAEDELDEETREAFAATEDACRAVGWEFEWAGRPNPVFMANVRRLAVTGELDAVGPTGWWPGSWRSSVSRRACGRGSRWWATRCRCCRRSSICCGPGYWERT